MIEEKKSLKINYLTFEQIKVVYDLFFDGFKEMDEPIPHWSYVDKRNINHLVEIPKISFENIELYTSLEEKAAEIFYFINKGHIFPNGNKRFSIAFTTTFLIINNYKFIVNFDEMTRKALEIAQSNPGDFKKVKENLARWIKENMVHE